MNEQQQTNVPLSPRAVLYRLWNGVIPDPVCQAASDELGAGELEQSFISRADGDRIVDPTVRVADHRFVEPTHWIGSFVSHYANEANSELWNLDVSGLATLSFIRYTPGGHFTWHVDALDYEPSEYRFPGSNLERKLSVTVNLTDPSDYDGGDLEFLNPLGKLVHQDEIRDRGSVTVFPSTVGHRVTPLTRGVRDVIVGWMAGPQLR